MSSLPKRVNGFLEEPLYLGGVATSGSRCDGLSNAIDEFAKRGWELFNNEARSNKCHALTETTRDATNLIDNDFHNIGIGII